MNLLIIGGSGHVSGTLAQAALGGGHDVWTITSGKRPLPEGVNPLISDRHDYEALTTIVAGEEIVWDLVVDCICYDVPDIRQAGYLRQDRYPDCRANTVNRLESI